MTRWLHHLSRGARRLLFTVLAVLTVAWALVTWWSLRPYHNITFTPFTADRGTYQAGDVVTLTNEFCWDGIPFRAERLLVTVVSEQELGGVRFPNGYAIPAIEEKYQTGCSFSTVRVQLPQTAAPGEYTIRYDVTYEPDFNPIRVVRISNESTPFTITEGTP